MPPGCRTQERLACLTYRQATLVSGIISMILSILIFVHEVALEGGFNLRNYVILAFCMVWLIVAALLVLGTYKRAHFLLLPWMVLTCMLTPLFVVGIVAGCRFIAVCLRHGVPKSCAHELHIFGTKEHLLAGLKLTVLFIMFFINSGSMMIVYRYFMLLSSTDNRKRKPEASLGEDSHSSSVRYERFKDDSDPETNVPLCEDLEDGKETIT